MKFKKKIPTFLWSDTSNFQSWLYHADCSAHCLTSSFIRSSTVHHSSVRKSKGWRSCLERHGYRALKSCKNWSWSVISHRNVTNCHRWQILIKSKALDFANTPIASFQNPKNIVKIEIHIWIFQLFSNISNI